MKRMLVLLGVITTMLIGTQSFAACSFACPCPAAPCYEKITPCCPAVKPCPCPACPVATPCCDPCNNGCNSCNSCCPRKKCSWWKFWENKNCCDRCDKCNRCNDCCN